MPSDLLGLDPDALPVPKDWNKAMRSAFIHAVEMAFDAFLLAVGKAEEAENPRMQQQGRIERLEKRIDQLEEIIAHLQDRLGRVPAHQRPNYTGLQRLRILLLAAEAGWSYAQVAAIFLISKSTVYLWNRRRDEQGDEALLRMDGEPVNKYSEAEAAMVRHLQAKLPHLGCRELARMLVRAGWHVAKSTVHRMRGEAPGTRKPPPEPQPEVDEETSEASSADTPGDAQQDAAEDEEPPEPPVVTSDHPNHVWLADLTTIPVNDGLRSSWSPFSKVLCWPQLFWLVFIVDHYSRRMMCAAAFKTQPTSQQVCDLLDATCIHHGVQPDHMITDKGGQFWSKWRPTKFVQWCEAMDIGQRFGAVGKKGSISVTERLIRTAKRFLRRLFVPLDITEMQTELNILMDYYNGQRGHGYLNCRTPDEVYFDRSPECEKPRLEPRPFDPAHAPCAGPQAPVRGSPGARMQAQVTYYKGRRHLPIVRVTERAV